MLHLLSLLLTLLHSPVGAACPLSEVSAVDFATTEHKARLKTCIIEQTVLFRGVARLPKHVVVPGQQSQTFGGVQLQGNRILSVLGVVQNHSLFLNSDSALDVLRSEAKTGVAILKGISSSKVIAKSLDKVSAGRVFFAIDRQHELHRFEVLSKGTGAFGYYWRARVRLSIGTPIFNARGEWVSLSALPADAGHTYVLPQEAFEDVEFLPEGAP
jgi:hypothetical protein